mmetsp:Transcript_22428/g.36049  ORF Transcript_22428/g.36049 Transcript_22428/m.36049 type:complete len:287 (+) Transcript_22428:437-1297(+)
MSLDKKSTSSFASQDKTHILGGKENSGSYGPDKIGIGDIEACNEEFVTGEERSQKSSSEYLPPLWKGIVKNAYFMLIALSLPLINLLTVVHFGHEDEKDLKFHWIYWPILASYMLCRFNLYITTSQSEYEDQSLFDRVVDFLTSDVGRACVLVWIFDLMLNTTVNLDLQNMFYDILYDSTAITFCYLLNYRCNLQLSCMRMRIMNISHFANAAIDAVFYLWVYYKQNKKAQKDSDSSYDVLIVSLDLIFNLQFFYALLEFSFQKLRMPLIDAFRRPRYSIRCRKWT